MRAQSFALLSLLAGCATITVDTDYDRKVDFSAYRTFSIAGGRTVSDGVESEDTLLKDRIEPAIAGVLMDQGLEQVAQNPDLVVSYVAGARTRQELESYGPYGFGWDPIAYDWWGPAYDDFWVYTYQQGTIVIDLIDPKTRKVVWRSSAATVGQGSRAPGDIYEMVADALRDYPPGAEKKKKNKAESSASAEARE